MEGAFIRAQLYIDAIKGCNKGANLATIKYYADGLEKELVFIKKDFNAKLRDLEQKLDALDKQTNTSSGWGVAKEDKFSVRPKQVSHLFGPQTKPTPKQIPPPEVSYDQQAEKK